MIPALNQTHRQHPHEHSKYKYHTRHFNTRSHDRTIYTSGAQTVAALCVLMPSAGESFERYIAVRITCVETLISYQTLIEHGRIFVHV